MKKIIYFLGLILFFACSEDEGSKKEIADENSAMKEYFIENRKAFTDPKRKFLLSHPLQIQKEAYRRMSDDEKIELWRNKIEKCSNNSYFTRVQQNYLHELSKNLTFSKLKNDLFHIGIEAKMKELNFSIEEFELIFYTLNDLDSKGQLINEPQISFKHPLPIAADCYTSWCVPCGEKSDSDCVGGCTAVSTGCGLFWGDACDKICVPK